MLLVLWLIQCSTCQGLLAEVKAATPRRARRGVQAERLVYGGLLAQLTRVHLAKGGRDRRRVTLRDMQAAGVRLDCRPQASTQRLDSQWAMRQWHKRRAADPAAGPEGCSQAQTGFYKQWRVAPRTTGAA